MPNNVVYSENRFTTTTSTTTSTTTMTTTPTTPTTTTKPGMFYIEDGQTLYK